MKIEFSEKVAVGMGTCPKCGEDAVLLEGGLLTCAGGHKKVPCSIAPFYIYANAYLVTQGYGGPEEGGWTYDVGKPLAACPMGDHKPESRETMCKALFQMFSHLAYGQPGSVNGSAEVKVKFQPHIGRPYPEGVPPYE